MIVKIQIPLMTTGEPEALIYNEDKDVFLNIPTTDAIIALFPTGEFKVYHYAHVGGTLLHIDGPALWQDW